MGARRAEVGLRYPGEDKGRSGRVPLLQERAGVEVPEEGFDCAGVANGNRCGDSDAEDGEGGEEPNAGEAQRCFAMSPAHGRPLTGVLFTNTRRREVGLPWCNSHRMESETRSRMPALGVPALLRAAAL
mmetsp:Transcript_40316/g.115258  ORF Transcript_40316/g.115258 Transcript_40316/m.115258 type:complete len:129 (-) Transcript_40316:94-480(-)